MPDLQERITAGLENRYTIKGELGSGGMAVVYLLESGDLDAGEVRYQELTELKDLGWEG